MSRSIFTPEELAELAAADAEIEDDDALTLEEYRESMRRDREIAGPMKPYSEARRAREREHSRKRRQDPGVAEKQRQAHRAWYAKNHEYALAWQREYSLTHTDAKRRSTEELQRRLQGNPAAAEMRELRKALGLTMRQLSLIMGRSYQVIHYWETGKTRVPAWALERLRELADAAGGDLSTASRSPSPEGEAGTGERIATGLRCTSQ